MEWTVEKYKGHENMNLIKLMDYHGYNTVTLAKAAGVSTKSIWAIKYGTLFPRIDTVLLVCKALNCTVDYLYPME